jgi:type VI secretion system protein ImpG
MGAEFAGSYRDVADRLRLDPNRAEDPHVERLLQGVAFLTARVHLRIDDDFPEFSQALFNVVYPHYLRPTPAMSIAQFRPDPGSLTAARGFPRNTRLISPPTKTGERFKFRTCYDTTLLPVEVRDAGWHSPHEVKSVVATDSVAVLRVDLASGAKTSFDEIGLPDLRFYLDGDPGLIGTLYELVLNNCARVVAWNPALGRDGPVLHLPGSAVRAVGFEPEEGMLPVTRRSFHPYQLLHDYFAFPQKYHFIDIVGLAEARRNAGGGPFGQSLQLLLFISAFERSDRHRELQEAVDARTMRLACTPIVNLYRSDSRPIDLTQTKSEYEVSVPGRSEVFSVERVFATLSGSTEKVTFAPFYALRHGPDDSQDGKFWFLRREPRDWSPDSPSDVFLSFVDLEGSSVRAGKHSVFADLLCFDGDLPNEAMGARSVLHLEDEGMPVEVLLAPTKARQPPIDRIDRRSRARYRLEDQEETKAPIRPPGGGRQHWRLVSMLSLNHLSLVEEGVDAFREMLRLHDPGGSIGGERHIQGLLKVSSEPIQAAVHGEHGLGFARGRSVEMHFDEELFAGAGVHLFASVIERFLGMYASINSFSRLTVTTRQRSEPLASWPPRAGLRPLI